LNDQGDIVRRDCRLTAQPCFRRGHDALVPMCRQAISKLR
jgi:hypothetical protein